MSDTCQLQTNPESQLLKANKWLLRLKYCLSALFAVSQQSAFCSYHTPEREEEKEEVRTSGLCGTEN